MYRCSQPIEKSDIYSIFGNALDNAIQAVMAEAPENRSVNIRVSDVVGMTQIVFENFCSKPPEMHEGLPKTEKDTQYHGFGLRSIRYIIEKYDGHMSIDTKDQMFILSASAAASAAVGMTIYAQKATSFDTNAFRVVFL